MINYIEMFNNIKSCKDLISISENPEYNALEFQKQNSSWDYSSPVYTYLGNIAGDWEYQIPDSDERVGYCSALPAEYDYQSRYDYLHGYDKHDTDDLCKKIISLLGFDYEYLANVNVQPPNVVRSLHYDDMITFMKHFKHLHDHPFDKKQRQPVHKFELKRVFVALEDWQDGWMFQMGTDQWAGWKKGDVIDFHWREQPHSTGNASYAFRPLLKISGFSNISYFGSKTL